MPARSQAQQRLFAIAEHHPEKLHSANRGLAALSKQTLHDFAATPTAGLPKRARSLQKLAGAKRKRSIT